MIVGVGCWRGTGASTTALLLAAALGERVGSAWLVEGDAAGGVLANRVGLAHDDLDGPGGVGIERLATARADHPDAARHLDEVGVDLGAFVLVPAPADPFRAAPCLTTRVAWIHSLRTLPAPVVVDVGRLRPGSVPWPLIAVLDGLLLVTTPEANALVATDDWISADGRVLHGDTGLGNTAVSIVVADAPVVEQRFARRVAEAELGDRLAAWLPWSPDGVAALLRGADLTDRRVRRRGLASAARRLASRVLSDAPSPREVTTA